MILRKIIIITLFCFIVSSALANNEEIAQGSNSALTQEDTEIVQMLDLLQNFEILKDEDFDLLENLEVIESISENNLGEKDE